MVSTDFAEPATAEHQDLSFAVRLILDSVGAIMLILDVLPPRWMDLDDPPILLVR